MIKNIKHILWLIKQMIILFFKGDLNGSAEAFYFLKMHWNYDSKRIHWKTDFIRKELYHGRERSHIWSN